MRISLINLRIGFEYLLLSEDSPEDGVTESFAESE
jgi:hypothetical protein